MDGRNAADVDFAMLFERIPGHNSSITKLLLESEEFRSVCEDYCLALAALAHFKKHPEAENGPEVVEYQNLIPELEGEIRAFIQMRPQM